MLYYTNKFCGYAASYLRILLSATLGALWAVIVQISAGTVRNIFHICTYLVVSFLMVMIISGTYNPKRNIKGTVILYIITFAFAGAVHMLVSYTDMGRFIGQKILSRPELLVYVIVAAVIIKICAQAVVRIMQIREYIVKVDIRVAGRNFTVNGLVDTGNHLTDPYNGKPVCVIDKNAVPDNIYIGQKEKVHYIPISSVGCGNGVIQVFTAETCRIYNSSIEMNLKDVLVGISENVISHGDDYDMLVNPLLIKMGDDSYGIKSSSRR